MITKMIMVPIAPGPPIFKHKIPPNSISQGRVAQNRVNKRLLGRKRISKESLDVRITFGEAQDVLARIPGQGPPGHAAVRFQPSQILPVVSFSHSQLCQYPPSQAAHWLMRLQP